MNTTRSKIMMVATAAAFAFNLLQTPVTRASDSNHDTAEVEIIVKVSQQGFADVHGKLFGPKHPLRVPEEKAVRITFVFDEKMTSLAYGDTHQIAIGSMKEKWTKESDKIWMFQQKASISFRTGEEGTQYRGYCILDCIGMDHLNNLVIEVV